MGVTRATLHGWVTKFQEPPDVPFPDSGHLRPEDENLKKQINASSNYFVVIDRTGSMCNPRNLSMNFTKSISKFKLSKEEIETQGKDASNYMKLPQITFHGLRHTHATILIFAGENIKIASERLGHKDVTITLNTYAHVMDLNRKNTANTLNMLFESI